MRSIKEAVKNIKRNKSVSSAAIFCVGLTLFLIGSSFAFGSVVNRVSTQAVDSLRIVVYIDPSATDENITKLGEDIKQISGVSAVEFSSKEQELENIAASYGDVGGELVNYFGDSNPLSDVYLVTVYDAENNLSRVSNDIAQMEFVQSTDYGSTSVDSFITFIKNLQIILIIVSLFFLVISFFLISNTIKIAIEHRRNEIYIMKLVGATNAYIRNPFLMEGIIIGLLGSIVPIAIISLFYNWVYNGLAATYEIKKVLLNGFDMFIIISVVLIVVAVIVGLISSWWSLRQSLRERKN